MVEFRSKEEFFWMETKFHEFSHDIFRAVSELAEALRDSDDIKKDRNETQKENKDLRERLEIVEKSLRMKSLQRSTGHSHSHDSAIDSDLQEWETEAVDIDMGGLGKFLSNTSPHLDLEN